MHPDYVLKKRREDGEKQEKGGSEGKQEMNSTHTQLTTSTKAYNEKVLVLSSEHYSTHYTPHDTTHYTILYKSHFIPHYTAHYTTHNITHYSTHDAPH